MDNGFKYAAGPCRGFSKNWVYFLKGIWGYISGDIGFRA